jgi:uncharacterized membrane protein
MAPLLVLVGLFALLTLADLLSANLSLGWWNSLRFALAGMFLLTASAHWDKRRQDLIRMVPPSFPRPDLLVTLTGVLEAAGAVALCVPMLAPYAAIGFALLLLAMFPANMHAAREKLTIGGRPVLSLVPRALLQLVFIVAAVAVYAGAP